MFYGLLRAFPFIQAILIAFFLSHCGNGVQEDEQAEVSSGVSNRPPVIKSAAIRPDCPTVKQDLRAAVLVSDPDGDPLELQYQWIINGQEARGATEETLSRNRFQKGDEIQCAIVPYDELAEGKLVVTQPVKVVDAIPVIEDIRIEPEVLLPGGEARVVVKAHDEDGDALSYFCEWYVNDQLVQTDGETCSLENLRKKDRISVKISVSDGELQRQWVQSKIVAISNRPPQIISEPPSQWDTEEGFLYTVQVVDPDEDPIRIRIEGETPPGLLWDEETLTVTWKPTDDLAEGAYGLRVIAEDGDGGTCTQEFTLTLATEKEGG
jgi:hypothetical protein